MKNLTFAHTYWKHQMLGRIRSMLATYNKEMEEKMQGWLSLKLDLIEKEISPLKHKEEISFFIAALVVSVNSFSFYG